MDTTKIIKPNLEIVTIENPARVREVANQFEELSIHPPKDLVFYFSISLVSVVIAGLSQAEERLHVLYDAEIKRPLGYAHLIEDPKTQSVSINLLEVFKHHCGLGRELMESIFAQGYQKIEAEVSKKPSLEMHAGVQAFYANNGFVPELESEAFTTMIWKR